MKPHVEQVMSQTVISCRPSDPASLAAELMWNGDVGFLPVVDDDGRAIAAVTDRDICMGAMLQGKTLSAMTVRDVMSSSIATLRPDDTLRAAEELMCERRVRRVPVVDDADCPIGVITMNDLARATEEERGPSAKDVTRVFEAITRPAAAASNAAE